MASAEAPQCVADAGAAAECSAPVAPPPPPPPDTLLALLWRRYLAQLSAAPLQTKCATAAVIAALGELLAQALAPAPRRALAPARAARFAAFGLLWSGPALHFWQRQVERAFASRPPTAATAAQKVLLDQLTFGPASNIAFMAFLTLAIERRGVGALRARVAADLPRVQRAAWRYWPLVAALNYRYVPPPLRPLTANAAGLLWSAHLALSARRAALLPKKAA